MFTPGRIVTAPIATPLGTLLAGASADGICLLGFSDSGSLEPELRQIGQWLKAEHGPGASPFFEPLDRQLQEYFAGKRRIFDLPLVLAGTPFQQKAWTALLTIPYGTTRTYKQQAEAVGMATAVRAVANANGANPIVILVPCHRVIGANGKLTGYGGGLWRKQRLLDLETGHMWE